MIERAIEAYREHGFARIPGLAPDDVLAALRARTDDVMLGKVDPSLFFFQHDTETGRYEDLEFGRGWVGPSPLYRKIEKLERDAVFASWIGNPTFERIVREVVGEGATIYRAIVMSKAPRGGTVLPWHQDAGALWGLDRDPVLQIWTALDDAPVDAGCMELVPGSHRRGLATPLGGMIPDEVALRAAADERAVPVPARAGDVVLLHNLVWHRSGRNGTDAPRRALSVCFLHPDTRCVRKRRAPRVFPPVAWSGQGAGT